MMAQQVTLNRAELTNSILEYHREVLHVPPVFMSTNSASSLLKALECTVPRLDWAHVLDFAHHTPFVVLSLCGDLDRLVVPKASFVPSAALYTLHCNLLALAKGFAAFTAGKIV